MSDCIVQIMRQLAFIRNWAWAADRPQKPVDATALIMFYDRR